MINLNKFLNPFQAGPPTDIVGVNQSVKEGEKNITLDGRNSFDQDMGKLSYFWSQIHGETIQLKHPGNAMTTFDSPNVTKDTRLIFQLTVLNTRGLKGHANVGVIFLNNVSNDDALFDGKCLVLFNLERY